MWIDGAWECFTLEDEVREGKIPGRTAIPEGEYEVIVNMSQRFRTELPLLLNVPDFTGVRIHPGNTEADTEGCILVGQERTEISILRSKAAFRVLLGKIKTAISTGGSVVCAVENAQEA
jgi:hypothetical protein